uniref:TetR/AcrR family transcriptional regulator n=1 Tax=Rhodococcus sp. KRD162 TaxID=2729725 RepID=UPI0019D136F2
MARSRATDNETLLRAAAEVFESKGYSNATIDDIAEAAGISRPTVYKYTSSKRSLLDDMVNMVCADLDERLHLVVCSDAAPTVRLRRLIDLHVESATKMKQFYSIVFSEQAELSEHAEVRWSEFTHAVAMHPGYRIYSSSDGHVALAALEPHFWERARAGLGVEGTQEELEQ